MYLNSEKQINASFIDEIVEKFGAEVENLNFKNRHESAARINKWCRVKTENQIKQIIDPAHKSRASCLILINAIYFKATWHHQFNSKNTHERDFFLENGHVAPLRMMTNILNLKICENMPGLNAGVCQLPYKGKTVFMSIILPQTQEIKINEIEERLDILMLKKCFEQDAEKSVKITFPKFKFEYEKEVLLDILKNLTHFSN